MNQTKKTLIAAALFAVACLTPARADNYFETNNAPPALRVWNGGTGVLVVAVTTNGGGANCSITTDGLATTLDGSSASYDTVGEWVGAINAVTNRDGTFTLTADGSVSLNSDTVQGKLLDGSYTGAVNAWLEIPFNTTNALHLTAAIPKSPIFARGTQRELPPKVSTGGKVASVYGDIAGTGNVTLSVWVSGNLKYRRVITSPQYVLGAGNTNVADATVFLSVEPNVPYGPQDAVVIRAARGTTMTTSANLGVLTEPAKY